MGGVQRDYRSSPRLTRMPSVVSDEIAEDFSYRWCTGPPLSAAASSVRRT